MRAYVFFIFLLVAGISASAQEVLDCDCPYNFKFVLHEVETNYAGFKDKVTDKTRAEYQRLTQGYLKKLAKQQNHVYCMAFINDWLQFFHDNHLQINGNEGYNQYDTAQLNPLIRNTEVIEVTEKQQRRLAKQTKEIEGIYVKGDSSFVIALIKDKNEFRDYAGVVLSTKSKLWKPGQVALEIRMKDDDTCDAIVYRTNHTFGLVYGLSRSSFLQEWRKTNQTTTPVKKDKLLPVQAKKLSDSTFYLQIATFHEGNAKAIDSVIKKNERLLRSMPNLVLDLRDNGGGSDLSYAPLLPWLYTDPVIEQGNDVLATEENIRRWGEMLNNTRIPADAKGRMNAFIADMRMHVGSFVTNSVDDTMTFDNVEAYPRKVVVLINNRCASSTEQLLLFARQSKKVTLMGENTSGTLDYSNMKKAVTYCGDVSFKYATTRSRRIDANKGIDNVGIKPQITLTPEMDWVAEALKYVEKK
jgi:hypothetical protein